MTLTTGRWLELATAILSPDLHLLQRWVEQGEGDQGIFCLTRLIESKFLERVNAAALATQLARIHSLRGDYQQAQHWLEHALANTSPREGRRIRAVALHEIGSILLYRRENREAGHKYREALQLCLKRPVHTDEAAANRVALATIAYSKYRWPEVTRLATRARRESGTVGDHRHLLAAERLLAMTLDDLGCYDEARTQLEGALAMARAKGAAIEEARLLDVLGWHHYGRAHVELRPPAEAQSHFQEAHAAARRVHNLFCQLDASLGLAWAALAEGATDEAHGRFAEVLDRLPEGSHLDLLLGVKVGLAAAVQRSGALADAARGYQEAIAQAEEYVFRNWAARGLAGWGGVLWHTGRQSEAEVAWQRARDHARRTSPRLRQITETNLALCRGDANAAPR